MEEYKADDKLRQLQLCELEILDEFVRVCEKHGLQYYLVGGTLLGAVRHQGFIPWDDDIDVAMPREDYDRFAALSAEELDPRFFYQCPDTDPDYFLTYAKIRKNKTEVYEERFKDAKFRGGVFIDIFPLDFCPAPGLLCHLLFNVLAVMNYRGQVDSGERYIPYEELAGRIGFTLLKAFSPAGIVRLRKRLLSLSKKLSDGEHIASFSGAYGYHKEIALRTWYGKAAVLPFEGRMCSCPGGFHELLSLLYGENYMELPPDVEKRTHIRFL